MRHIILCLAFLTFACGTPSKHLDLPEMAWSGGDATIQSSSEFPSYMVRFPTTPFAPVSHGHFELARLPEVPLVVGFLVEDYGIELEEQMERAIAEARSRLSVTIECGDRIVWVADGRLDPDTDCQSDWILTTFHQTCFYYSQSPYFTPSSGETYVVKVRIAFDAAHALPLTPPLQLRLVMYFGGSHDKRG